jgi:2-amino-4-hydroxy-6-hydroxymethyldihydropteridine diphosphokinase
MKIYLGLGTNLGDRLENLREVERLLVDAGVQILQKSPIYETEPVGLKNQGWFLNMVVEAETDLSAQELLQIVKQVESSMGREKANKWGPRIIDIDILLFGQEVVDSEDLQIPHRLMHKRKFVLIPFNEIAPDVLHPKIKKTVKELLNECDDAAIVRPL